MKKQEIQVKKNTTNYPKDTHKEFCARCLKHHRMCPETGTQQPSKHCSL